MRICKSKLIHPVTGVTLMVCDRKTLGHEYHIDELVGAEWRKDYEGIGVTQLRPTHPKIYRHKPEPEEAVKVVLDA